MTERTEAVWVKGRLQFEQETWQETEEEASSVQPVAASWWYPQVRKVKEAVRMAGCAMEAVHWVG